MSVRQYFVAAILLTAPAFAQTKQPGVITLGPNGTVVKFYGMMQMLDAHPLPRHGLTQRYVSEQFSEASYAQKYVCAMVLTVEGSRSSIVAASRSLGVSMNDVPMYSVAQECFSFNGAEVDFHAYSANADGWQIQDGSSFTGRDQTGAFKPDDPDRDIAAFEYVVPRFKQMSEEYQRSHPDGAAVSTDTGGPPFQPDRIYKISDPGVLPPILIHSVNAEFSQDARQHKIHGVSVVSMIVDENGMPQGIHTVRALGHGLDEQAIAAVHQYRFKPSTYRGHPIPMEITIEVNFHIY